MRGGLEMLLEIDGSRIIIDKNPYIQDLKINIDILQRLLRLKLKYIIPEGLEPVDLAMSYDIPQVSITSASISIKFTGKELLKNISFQEELSFNLVNKTFHLKGIFGTKNINQKITKISDILEIIKSELVTIINDK
jgi:hypothetical protein